MFFNMFLKHNNKPLCIPLKHAEAFFFQLADVCLQVSMLDCYCARKLRRKKKSFHISFSISGGESYCVLIREKDEIIKAVYSLVSLLGSQRSVCFLISFSPSSAFGTSSPSPFLHPLSFLQACLSVLSVSFVQFASVSDM